VYGWEQNPLTDRHPFRCSNSSADYAVKNGIAFKVVDGDGRTAIQLAEPKQIERELQKTSSGPYVSAKTILLFIKTHCQGDKLHYEIPMAGDRGIFARHRRKLLHPSHRIAPEIRALAG
jgi:hypothetical protein